MTLKELKEQTEDKAITIYDNYSDHWVDGYIQISVLQYYETKYFELVGMLNTENEEQICRYVYENLSELVEPLTSEEALEMASVDAIDFLEREHAKDDAIALERHLKGNG